MSTIQDSQLFRKNGQHSIKNKKMKDIAFIVFVWYCKMVNFYLEPYRKMYFTLKLSKIMQLQDHLPTVTAGVAFICFWMTTKIEEVW